MPRPSAKPSPSVVSAGTRCYTPLYVTLQGTRPSGVLPSGSVSISSDHDALSPAHPVSPIRLVVLELFASRLELRGSPTRTSVHHNASARVRIPRPSRSQAQRRAEAGRTLNIQRSCSPLGSLFRAYNTYRSAAAEGGRLQRLVSRCHPYHSRPSFSVAETTQDTLAGLRHCCALHLWLHGQA